MNDKRIEAAKDIDLRLSAQALKRAAVRARQLALQTQTFLVVSQQGKLKHISPDELLQEERIQEEAPPYGDKP